VASARKPHKASPDTTGCLTIVSAGESALGCKYRTDSHQHKLYTYCPSAPAARTAGSQHHILVLLQLPPLSKNPVAPSDQEEDSPLTRQHSKSHGMAWKLQRGALVSSEAASGTTAYAHFSMVSEGSACDQPALLPGQVQCQ
jgi:hypothetical protein